MKRIHLISDLTSYGVNTRWTECIKLKLESKCESPANKPSIHPVLFLSTASSDTLGQDLNLNETDSRSLQWWFWRLTPWS